MNYDDLISLALGHISFQLVWAGMELGLFSYLYEKDFADIDEIADALGLPLYSTKVLLSGLSSIGFLEKRKEHYQLSEKMRSLMDDYPIGRWHDIMRLHFHVVYPALLNFVDALRTGSNLGLNLIPGVGDTLYEKFQSQPHLKEVFYRSMNAISSMVTNDLASWNGWSEIGRLLDIGGGDAVNALAIASYHPDLRISIFDLPSTCELAKEKIKEANLVNRIEVIPGNFFSESFPSGFDGILFAHIMPIWSEEKNKFLLKKAYDSLPRGGKVFIFSMMSNDTENGPSMCTLSSVYFLAVASGEGMLYPRKDYEKWLTEIGFSSVSFHSFPFYHIMAVATK